MFTTKKLESEGSTDEVTVGFAGLAGFSLECSADFVGTIKVKRRLLPGSPGRTVQSVTESAEITRTEVPGAILYCEIEPGDISGGFATVEMRT